MKKIILIAAAAAVACAASAQNNGQLHFLTPEGSRMFKSSEISKITYEGNETDGFTHMNVATTSGDPVQIALDGITGCEVRGAGLPDTDLSLAPKGTDAMALMTSCRWKLADIGTNYGTDESYQWIPEYSLDDIISFGEDSKVTIETGESNETYCDWKGAEEAHFTATGSEGYHLGYNSDSQLCIDFFGGAFPLVRPNFDNAGIGGIYEVRELTESTLKIYGSYGDGGYFYVTFKNADINPATILAGTTWKLASVDYPHLEWTPSIEEMPASADERMTFNADGTLTIVTDGIIYNNDENANWPVTTVDGDETWAIVKDGQGRDCIKFGGGAFPLMVSQTEHIDGTYIIEELTETTCKLGISYWEKPIHITLVPAE